MFSKVIYTAGTWDLFHVGHLRLLQRCKTLGDILIVGVSIDKLVKGYKGRNPFNSYIERYEIIKALRCVDRVIKQEELLDIKFMKNLKMDILVLGDDWEYVNVKGIKWARTEKEMIFLPRTKGVSTSLIKQKIKEFEGLK